MPVRLPTRKVDPASLAQHPLFADLTAEELANLAGCLRRRWFAKGDVVYLAGDSSTTLYLVEVGRVKLVLTSPEGKELILELAGPGELFGETEVLDGQPRLSDAIVQQPCQLLLLQRRDFLAFLEPRPRLALRMLRLLSGRVRRHAQTVQDAVFQDVSARLARAILDLADAPERAGSAYVVAAPPTQSELAGMIGATRESVNKWLGFYERHGVIRRHGRELCILRPDVLRQRAS
ncbi:MAG: Crp/Fnr family transcriptional regulator [Chloroflexi bacterium]|nr:Crp/Fnr family transcriptional regulator [Chloroflexota bacterium]